MARQRSGCSAKIDQGEAARCNQSSMHQHPVERGGYDRSFFKFFQQNDVSLYEMRERVHHQQEMFSVRQRDQLFDVYAPPEEDVREMLRADHLQQHFSARYKASEVS